MAQFNSRSPLTRVMFPEMTCRVLLLPPQPGTVLMRFDREDALNFNDHPKMWNLPDGAVALLTRSADWSAHNSTYGFVPADTLARFSSDPVQAAEELRRRGLWRQVKGGYQFTDWGQFGKTAEQAAREEAEAEAKRAYDAERQRKSRANRRAGYTGKIRAAAVTGDVTAMSHVTSRDTPFIDRSDPDQSMSAGQSKSQSDARARESPELVTAVTDAICAKVGYIPTEGQALAVIGAIRERARKAKQRIRNPLTYIPRSVENEPDLYAGLLDGDPPPASATITDLLPGPSAERHEYAPDYPGGPCRCGYTKSSPRHTAARAG